MLRKSRATSDKPGSRARRGLSEAPRAGRYWWRRAKPPSPEGGGAVPLVDGDVDVLRRPPADYEIVDALVPDTDQSEVFTRWRDRLGVYVDQQGPLDALRLRSSGEPPWPPRESPMLAYLLDRSAEIVTQDGVDTALAWLAKHAWFEGVIAERARISRLIDQD